MERALLREVTRRPRLALAHNRLPKSPFQLPKHPLRACPQGWCLLQALPQGVCHSHSRPALSSPQPSIKQAPPPGLSVFVSPVPTPGPARTVGPLQEEARGDGVEHSHAADVAPVVLDEALELLHRLVATAPLELLSVRLGEQQGLKQRHPGRQQVLALIGTGR